MNRNSESRRQIARPQRRRSRLRAFVTALQIIILLLMGTSIGVALGLFVSLSKTLPNVGDTITAPEATIIYSSDGVILGRVFREDRTTVPLKDIPKDLRDATIAIEDSRFYQHSGVDLKGIARALWHNVRRQQLAHGGSTITQQLAKNVYLSPKKTIERKIKEAALAVMIERHYTKDKILEMYLNQVYYGSGAFGVQAASKVYFAKDVDQLTLSEAALLAGLPKKPSVYSPHEDKEQALQRRDIVLNRMYEVGLITKEERNKAKNEKIEIVPREKGRSTYKAPHFVDHVTKILKQRYGEHMVVAGGLRVYTTLNYEMQKAAETALREHIKANGKYRNASEGCFIAIEPATGYIRAMVGSVNPNSHFNRCTQAKRQPGSAFKAFVYTAALASGMKPDDRVLDERKTWPQEVGEPWSPRNYDGKYRGWVTLKTAVAKSINIPAIKVAEKVGIHKVIKYAHMMGVKSELEPYLSTAIGGVGGVHPIEMCSAYGTFANNGVHVDPMAITRVTNSKGETLEDYIPEGERVISQKVNAMMDEMLRAVVTSGTGRGASSIKDARGKTGTTNDERDAWWIGYVPGKLVAACWVGNDDYSSMKYASGSKLCVPVWVKFMEKAIPVYNKLYRSTPANQASVRDYTKEKQQEQQEDNNGADTSGSASDEESADVQPTDDSGDNEPVSDDGSDVVTAKICDESQLLATRHCPSTHAERFLRGLEPTERCTIHGSRRNEDSTPREERSAQPARMVSFQVCPDSGLIAGPNCPNPERRRALPEQMPSGVCNIHGNR